MNADLLKDIVTEIEFRLEEEELFVDRENVAYAIESIWGEDDFDAMTQSDFDTICDLMGCEA